jgi:protein-S-isoprenylcysteine O-methyltransferase Ste14
MPGVVALYVPWRFFGLARVQWAPGSMTWLAGAACIALGAVLLAACIFEFARTGRGTLSPLDPPRALVVRGLYRYVRNPMYLSVTTIVVGEALLVRSYAILAYLGVWFLAVNAFVVGYEEPTLRRRFGQSYLKYTNEVGRWIPCVDRSRGLQ